MIITVKWIGNGTDIDPYTIKLPAQYAGRGWSIVANQAAPKKGAIVKVNVF